MLASKYAPGRDLNYNIHSSAVVGVLPANAIVLLMNTNGIILHERLTGLYHRLNRQGG